MTQPPIRVLFVMASLAVSGGSERQVVQLATSLDDRFEPMIVCTKGLGELAGVAIEGGVEVAALGLHSGYDLRTLPRLLATVRSFSPDIIHCTNFNSTAWGRAAGIVAGTHGLVTAEHSTVRTRGVEKVVLPWCNALFGGRTDAIVACGHNQVAALVAERNPAERIRVIVNGVDVDRYGVDHDPALRAEWGVPPGSLAVGIVAELRPEKNHEMLLRAAGLLAESGVECHVVIVGDGPERPSLEAMARELGIDEHVLFTGWHDDVPRILMGLDVVALTSLFETFPLCVLEGMAAGRPVVATSVGDVPIMVADGDTGFVVPVDDAAALADRLGMLAADPGLRARMGVAGRRRVAESYSKEAMIRAYEDLYISIARPGPVGSRGTPAPEGSDA